MTQERQNISTGTPWEPLIGYSRAVRTGNLIFVSGTTAIDIKGDVLAPSDPYEQTKKVIDTIRQSLEQAGARLSDVVRTRMFVTDLAQWKAYALAHREAFGDIRPANTFVQVARLIDPRMMIEMEADAVLGFTVEGE